MNTDTPETDECTLLAVDINFGGNFEAVHAQASRNLERQRNEARKLALELRDALFGLTEECLLRGFSQDWDTYTEAQAAIIKAKEALK